MADLMEYVNVLADQIGPRPVSTEEEHQASLYIAQELSDDGLDVSVDEFATPSGVRWPYVLAYVASALGTVISGIGIFVPGISLSMFIIGLILVAAGLFIYFTENNNNPILSKMRASGVSQNVVAKYVPASMAHDSRRRKKIIIAAHVDTVRAQPEASPQLIGHAPLLHKIIFYCMVGLVAVLFIRLLPLPWPEVIDTVLWVISLIASVYVLAAAACIVASRFTPYISGGNDNASSIAVLLSVARLLVNPDERERYMRDHSFRFGLVEEEEDDGAMGPVDSFAPSTGGDEPVMHSAEEAYAEGLIPEGVEVTYDDDGVRADATVAFPALTPEEQLDVLADTAAEELHLDTVSTDAFSLDDVEFEQEDAEVVPAKPGAISDMQVPDIDFTLDEEIDQANKKPVERLDDAVIFAEYMGNDDEHHDEAELELEAEIAAEATQVGEEPIEVEAQTEETPQAVEVAAEEVVEEEPPAPAPVYAPIETPTRSHDEGPQVARPVPSWYAAAKEKAAKDLEKKAVAAPQDEDAPVLSYRSRFADAPAATGGARVQQAEAEPETEEIFDAEHPVTEEVVDAVMAEVVETAQAEEAAAEQHEEQAAEIVEAVATAINLDIPDDQLDELSPDASGLFTRVEVKTEASTEEKADAPRKQQLTSRIPNIGSSDDKEREERKMAHESLAARASRPELQSIPVVDSGEGQADFEEMAVEEEVVEVAPAIESVIPATAKAQRKKPTARHVTQQFVPTRATHNRDIHLGENRQEAPVSSTFEDTPQATPDYDPFAPKDEAASSERSSRPAPRQRTSGYSAAYKQTSETVVPAANTSSFPSLTGSFPALSGAMPVIDAGDFADTADNSVIADDAALDSFMAAGQTTEINIPESRFRNAVDKVGGLFNRKNKNGAEDYDAGGVDAWSDEDDYGWKGGGYFEEEAESAYDAVRQRAAQIRESVVSMTENDLLDKEVWFVALGASGAGAQGMKNFLDLHSSELRGSLIINLEAVGAGTISYIDVEGTGKPRRADRRLMSLVKKASKEVRGTEMKAKSLEWRNTDATPAMIAGMRALTIMGFADNGVAPVDWHTAEDTANIVEEDKLEYMTRLLLKVIENS